MHMKEFGFNPTGAVSAAVSSGEPLELTRYRKPYAAVVPHDWYERAAAALAERECKEQEEQEKAA